MRRVRCVLLLAVLVGSAEVVLADPITVNASTDVWIRESAPDATYENDWVSVGFFPGDGDKRRYGLVEFDISAVTNPIVSAHLELYAMNYATNDEALSQQAGLLTPVGITSTTWNNLWTTKTETLIEGLGYMTLPALSPRATWYSSNAATTDDLTDLNALRISSGKVTLLLAAGGSRHEWGDIGSGFAPRLVLTTAVPEPTSLVIAVTGALGILCYAWRKTK